MELQSMIRKRGSLKAKLTSFNNFLGNVKIACLSGGSEEGTALIELEIRLGKIKELLAQFEEIQTEIEALNENFEEQLKDRENFENIYYSTIASAKSFLQEKTSSNNSNSSNSDNITQQLSNVKLPQIYLPKFDGSYESWLEFRDTFKSLIHSNNTIGAIQKFHYLRASVQDGAAQVIRSIEFSAVNCNLAWELLCERFDNRPLLIHNHVKALFAIPSLIKESSMELRMLVDHISKHLRSLQILEQPTEHWDTLIIFIVVGKLDNSTAREWEESKKKDALPTLEDLKTFLTSKANLLETLEVDKINKSKNVLKDQKVIRGHSFSTINFVCGFCKGSHQIYNCKEFLELSINTRIERVKNLRLCINCLKTGHIAKNCRSGKCRKCNAQHNTLLHLEKASQTSTQVSLSNHINSEASHVLIATAIVQVLDSNGFPHACRAILDSASQSNFISANMCQQLGLSKSKINKTIVGINQAAKTIEQQCRICVQSMHNGYQITMSALVLDKISDDLPTQRFNLNAFQVPHHIKLADPKFYEPGTIDLLLGADIFWNLLCIGQHSLSPTLKLQKTRLGWIVTGSVEVNNASTLHCNFTKISNIQNQLEKFWKIEDNISEKVLSADEVECERIFQESIKREDDGKFIVRIPLKELITKLGNSKANALSKLHSLERKFNVRPTFKSQYEKFMTEYGQLGHMSVQTSDEGNEISYFLPHHGVLNENSTTTKLRVVFDGSSVSDTGWSLNDLQFVGPTIQEDLFSIIVRFRQHRYTVCSDIKQMYRQIWVDPTQRSLQKILWRSSADALPKTYTLNTVTYGTTSAPFLAVRCLKQLAIENQKVYPEASNIIRRDFYVDDLITGGDTVEAVLKIVKDVIPILNSAGFELHKWTSNSRCILENLQQTPSHTNIIDLGNCENTRTLGLYWLCEKDVLFFKIADPQPRQISKRTILSDISQVFDPLGLLGPCVITAKIILQKLWLNKLSWDESLPHDIHSKSENIENWPQPLIQFPKEIPELRNHVKVHVSTDSLPVLRMQRFSSITRLKRVVAYCFRFVVNCKHSSEKRDFGPLKPTELAKALETLLKLSQHDSFSEEIRTLLKGKEISVRGKLQSLNPFLDNNGTIRVGGRLQSSNFNYEKKHPIVLSSQHYITQLIFREEHVKLLHAGPQLLLASIRGRYWPISGRNLARKTVRQCVNCFRANPTLKAPLMGVLPQPRVTPTLLFSSVGVDYAGAFTIKDRKGRGCKHIKCYICLFVCFATKAIHLELVTSLTTDSFMLALRRFVSRRGKPSDIFSDNGTNFVGANRELTELSEFLKVNDQALSDSLSKDNITWHFIPAHAAHFGGLWEAGVKLTKYHLKRILGNTILTFEEFYTILTQVESILNSRPLTPMSSDPNDYTALTPSHFLIGKTLTAIPDPDVTHIPENKLSHFQHIQQLQQHFWARWAKEYISELQQRQKWKKNQDGLKIGELVLIKEDNLPPLLWQLGRIIEVFPGVDGVARVATMRTQGGVVRRAFSRICPLPHE